MKNARGPATRDGTTTECRMCGPPYVFKHKPTEYLFLDYSFHIRRVTVSSLLGIYILLTAVLAILYFAYQKAPTAKNLYHVCLCVLGILLYIFINTKYLRSRRQLKVVSYLLWVLLLLFAFISLPVGAWIKESASGLPTTRVDVVDGLWQLLFIIYCMYLILPVYFFVTLVTGIVLPLVHTAVILIRLQDLPLIKSSWPQVLVNVVLLVIVNAVGIMAHHVGEKSQRESFINCRGYIGAKLQFQDQGQKLVKVTETCLPKFICHEVCADLTMYNNIVCPRQVFAKPYECVSIAYVNISGLEKLKAQTDPADYINIIDNLAVTFEALCEVHNCLALVLLGERFVAVNGIPLSDPQGPQSCVSLCVDMMQAVELIKQTTCSTVEALTGVHFGSVATGVVGTYRWQYTCCSNDLLLAKHVALTGAPGKVHITEPCLGYLPLNMYEVQQSVTSHGLNIPTYYIHPHNAHLKISTTVAKMSRRLNKVESIASFMRLDSMENEEPFFTQLFRTSESKPAMTTCLMDGKAFVHRLAHDNVENDVANRAFQHAVKIGSVEHETSEQLSFFTLTFHESLMESSFVKESKGFGLTLTFILLLLIALAVLHFTVLSRTMLMLSSVLFLFILLSLLCIAIIASKLNVIRCRCLSQRANKLALLIIVIVLIACTSLLNLLTCQTSSFYSSLPIAVRYAILSSDKSHTACASPYFMFLSGILVLFIISVTRISHIVHALLIVPITAGYVVVIAYTHDGAFVQHDTDFRAKLPPSSVMAIVALLHFALLHVMIGRHSEWVRRLDYIWRHKEMSSYQKAQDMITLRLGVADNALPGHVLSHYNTPECVMKPYSQSHNAVGVAFVTVPNFSGFINEMYRSNQPIHLIQVLHDVTSAFDHLLRRTDFHVVEKVYDDGLNYVLVSGVNRLPVPFRQHEQDYMVHHLSKLIDLLLDMKHCLLQLNTMSGRNLVLRAGISMGPVVEGVFGYKRPQYNIWGPAVDMAKNLELTGKMNHLQVNKEVAQLLRRRYQFQPRTQPNMAVLQELQPYVVISKRLQSVIASDNESVGSDGNYSARSPRLHNHSMGSISQAETVIVSSSQQLLAAAAPSRTRTTSFEIRPDPMLGMMYPSNSGNSTPSGSFTRHTSRETGFMDGFSAGWKLPQTPSLTKLTAASRPLSPELPAVHYTKNRTPPIGGRLPSSDSRGTIILTQANLTGGAAAQTNMGAPCGTNSSMSSEFVHPSAVSVQSTLPKIANVVNTDSMRNTPRKQLSPVGELAMTREPSRRSISSVSSSTHVQGRTSTSSLSQMQERMTPTHHSISSQGGRSTPVSAGSQRGKVMGNGFVFPAPQSPPPPARMSPALSYTKVTPPLRLPSRSSSQSSSHRNSPVVVQRTNDSSSRIQDYSVPYCTDTVPLLAACESPQQSGHRGLDHVDGRAMKKKGKPVILGLDRLMTSSTYSDKMQTSMEGNVSSTSTTPDEDVPLMMPLQLLDHQPSNREVSAVLDNDPSLSPLLQRQLNRFAKKRDSPHKSPHLPRKHAFHPNSAGSRTGGANTICSLSPPVTPIEGPDVHQPTLSQPQSSLTDTNSDDIHEGSSRRSSTSSDSPAGKSRDGRNSAHTDIAQWQGARPKQLPNISESSHTHDKLSPPPLPNPPPPDESVTESEMSEISDDDNENVRHVYDANITDYDNMYSTDYGTYDNRQRAAYPYKYTKNHNVGSPSKFMSKLEMMQHSGQNVKELYSEIESDAADCDSLVGDTDYEMEPVGPSSQEYGHPLHKLQWTENRLLALLRPSTGAAASTMGSTLRHCRSMELLPSESEEVLEKTRRRGPSQRKLNSMRNSQHFDDNMSITSSMLGSEYTKSDPNLSDIGAYESEYDNYRPGLISDDDFFSSKPITDIDLNQFGNIDFDKIKINESMTTQDYIRNLQQHIESKQRPHVVTDV